MKRFLTLTMAALMCGCGQHNGLFVEDGIAPLNPASITGKFTPEIMHTMGKVTDPQVSPDGENILYGVTYSSIELNRGRRSLFVMGSDGSDGRCVVSESKSVSNGRWVGNDHIAYLMDGQMYVAKADGSGRRKVSEVAGGISEFAVSPDCARVMYVSEFKVDEKDASCRTGADRYADLPKSDVHIVTDLMYRHWDHYVETIPHTFVASFSLENGVGSDAVDILDGAPYELPTEPFGGMEQLAWSPDGTLIAYSCRKLVGVQYAFSTNTDIYVYDVISGATINISEGMPGYDTNPVFSPDGRYVAWLSMERCGYEADKLRLFVAEPSGSGRRELSGSFKYNVESPAWAADSREIYFTSPVEGVQELWKCNLDGAFSRVTPEHDWFDFGAPIVAGDRIVTTNTSMMRPAEIVSVDIADGNWCQLTRENEAILNALLACKVEERWIPTIDGKRMLTWVVYPPDFSPDKVYPSVLVCLGGPQGTLSQGWSTRWNYRLMASQGFIVVLPNRRGTTAFGQEWCQQISGDYCGLNMQDYFSAADALKAEPYVGKMAAIGASYGGYSVYNLAGIHQGRFSAFIAHDGIFNLEHMYMETEEMWFPNWDNGGIAQPDVPQSGAPWSDNPVARRHYANSPHLKVRQWDTPIMIVHGEKDYRVPPDQGMAAFNAARMMGLPSKMLLYPEENHWVLKPQNSVVWHREVYSWLDQWLR